MLFTWMARLKVIHGIFFWRVSPSSCKQNVPSSRCRMLWHTSIYFITRVLLDYSIRPKLWPWLLPFAHSQMISPLVIRFSPFLLYLLIYPSMNTGHDHESHLVQLSYFHPVTEESSKAVEFRQGVRRPRRSTWYGPAQSHGVVVATLAMDGLPTQGLTLRGFLTSVSF